MSEPATVPVTTTTPTTVPAAPDPEGLTAYLQTPGQERALMPGGYLVGRVKVAVIEPFFALSCYSSGYTLADIKAANPGMQVLAYVNGAIAHEPGKDAGVFQTTLNPNDLAWLGHLVPAPNPSKWTGEHAGKAQTYQGKTYVGYGDFPGYYLTRIDLAGYRERFAAFARTILETPSRSTHGAPDAWFDGIMLDDTNMSPQHGLNIPTGVNRAGDAPEAYGPWTSSAAYGRDMVDFATDVARRLKAEFTRGAQPIVACNLGAHATDPVERGLALELAAQRAGGGPAVERMVREFSTVWNDGTSPLDLYTVQHQVQLAADLATLGVVMEFSDRAAPAAREPTPVEQEQWDRQQRRVMALALLAHVAGAPVQPAAQAVQVHEGRNQWEDHATHAQDMGEKVADLDSPALSPLTQDDPRLLTPVGRLHRTGDVLWRELAGGLVYANLGPGDEQVGSVTVPGRDGGILA